MALNYSTEMIYSLEDLARSQGYYSAAYKEYLALKGKEAMLAELECRLRDLVESVPQRLKFAAPEKEMANYIRVLEYKLAIINKAVDPNEGNYE
jgi:hypothetical protein